MTSVLRALPSFARQTFVRWQPSLGSQPSTPQALAEVERRAVTTALLVDKLPEWKVQEGQDWFAKNYYRIYLAFVDEVSIPAEWRQHMVGPDGLVGLTDDNRALVKAYDGLIDALQGQAQAPVQRRLADLRARGMQRVHRVFGVVSPGAGLILLALCWSIWRSQALNSGLAVALCLLLVGGASAIWIRLWQARSGFNPNNKAMAALQTQYAALEEASLKKIRDHAKDAAVELHYAATSGKSWVFSRLTNKWAGEKYMFLGDARYEASCINEVTSTFVAQAQEVAQGLSVAVKPINKLFDFSAASFGLVTQCPRCRITLETGDRFCMACGLRLTAPSR